MKNINNYNNLSLLRIQSQPIFRVYKGVGLAVESEDDLWGCNLSRILWNPHAINERNIESMATLLSKPVCGDFFQESYKEKKQYQKEYTFWYCLSGSKIIHQCCFTSSTNR